MKRLIPNLLIDEEKAIKHKKFKYYKYLGDPFNIVKILNDKEIDELIITDLSAFSDRKVKYITKLNGTSFMPVCYGGGIRSLNQAQKIMHAGVERIHLNTIIYSNPEEFLKILDHLGSSSIVAVLNIKKNFFGKYEYVDSFGKNRIREKIQAKLDWLTNNQVSEILINIVNKENSKSGIDREFIDIIENTDSNNFLINGGLVKEDLSDLNSFSNISGFVGANYFFCKGIYDSVLVTYDKRM